ncbi:hypothetical protein V9T40_006686 [Parthenolecanium corni]|uniref:Uncharacterized protein n=1 Tax=Parthenolecanium corni TaxID=536013 RepID=A0AAN9TRT9_9HEMI
MSSFQLVVAQDNCPGLRLSTGLGALLGDLPLSSSLPSLPSLPTVDSCGAPDLSLPLLPPLASGNCLPTFPLSPCESALASLPVPYEAPCLCKRSLERKRRCGCKEKLLPGLPFAPLLPPPLLPPPCFGPEILPPPCFGSEILPPPCFAPDFLPPPILEPYPLLRPKAGCLGKAKNTLTTCLLEKLLLKKGLTLGFGPDCGPDVGLLPEAVSTFAVDALARPLARELDDCGCL